MKLLNYNLLPRKDPVVAVLHQVTVKWSRSKGQKARSGGGVRLGFEGGQNSIVPLYQNGFV